MSLRMPGSWPANQLSKLLEEFRKDLLHHRYHIQDINDDPKEIFHPDDVTHFWIESPRGFSVSRVESLCRSLLEDKENAPVDDISKEMRKNMLRLVSVMLFCNWGNWDKFKDLILNAQPWPISDKSLPLKLTQIDHYLGGNEEDELDFDRHQWAFIPIIIGTLDRYTNDRYRPPFLRKKTVEIGSGSSAIVHKVVIPKGFYPDDLLAGSMAQKRQRKEANIQDGIILVWKRFGENSRDYFNEVKNLKLLANPATPNSHIMPIVGHLDYGSKRGIFFEFADYNLWELLRGSSDKINELRAKIRDDYNAPREMLKQMSHVSGALQYLHNNVKAEKTLDHLVCWHQDLHLSNIVIQSGLEDGKPETLSNLVGTWKIIDFGMASVKRKAEGTSESGTSRASNTKPRRYEGSCTAPEVEGTEKIQGDKGDIYSFGCILASVLAFALGGHDGALSFAKTQETESEAFYDKNIKGEPIPKLSVTRWPNGIKNGYHDRDSWIPKVVDVIDNCTQINSRDRASAKDINDTLDKIVSEMSNATHPPERKVTTRPSHDRSRTDHAQSMYSGPRDSAPSFPSTTPRRSLSPATSSITESSNKPQTEDAERNFSFMESIKACSSPTGNTVVYVGENVCYIGGIGTDKKFHRKVTRSISRRDGHFDCDKINVHDDMIALYIHLESRPRDIWIELWMLSNDTWTFQISFPIPNQSLLGTVLVPQPPFSALIAAPYERKVAVFWIHWRSIFSSSSEDYSIEGGHAAPQDVCFSSDGSHISILFFFGKRNDTRICTWRLSDNAIVQPDGIIPNDCPDDLLPQDRILCLGKAQSYILFGGESTCSSIVSGHFSDRSNLARSYDGAKVFKHDNRTYFVVLKRSKESKLDVYRIRTDLDDPPQRLNPKPIKAFSKNIISLIKMEISPSNCIVQQLPPSPSSKLSELGRFIF